MAESLDSIIKVPSHSASIGYVVLGSVLISLGPFFLEYSQLAATTNTFYRLVIGAIAFLAFSYLRKEQIPGKAMLGLCLFSGFLLALDLVTWNTSVLFIGSGLSTVLANLEIVFLVLIGCIFYKERLPPLFLKMFALIVFGVCFLIYPYLLEIHFQNTLGIILALGASFIYAIYILALKILGKKYPGTSSTASLGVICLLGALILGVFMLLSQPGSFYIPNWRSFICIICNSVMSQVFGWWFLTNGMRQLSLSLSGLLLLIQPALTFLLDSAFLGRNTQWLQILGCIILLAAVYGAMLGEKKKGLTHAK